MPQRTNENGQKCSEPQPESRSQRRENAEPEAANEGVRVGGWGAHADGHARRIARVALPLARTRALPRRGHQRLERRTETVPKRKWNGSTRSESDRTSARSRPRDCGPRGQQREVAPSLRAARHAARGNGGRYTSTDLLTPRGVDPSRADATRFERRHALPSRRGGSDDRDKGALGPRSLRKGDARRVQATLAAKARRPTGSAIIPLSHSPCIRVVTSSPLRAACERAYDAPWLKLSARNFVSSSPRSSSRTFPFLASSAAFFLTSSSSLDATAGGDRVCKVRRPAAVERRAEHLAQQLTRNRRVSCAPRVVA